MNLLGQRQPGGTTNEGFQERIALIIAGAPSSRGLGTGAKETVPAINKAEHAPMQFEITVSVDPEVLKDATPEVRGFRKLPACAHR